MKLAAGFTLLELMTVLMLTAILLGLSIPAYRGLVSQNRTSSLVNQLVATLNYARSEAVRRHQVITVCKSKEGHSCSGTWSDGWLVFVDRKLSGQVDAGDEIIRVNNSTPLNSLLQWSGSLSKDYLQMDASGAARGQAGTFTFYPDHNDKTQVCKIIVSQTGRVRVA